jgi:hypothetical protein
MNRCAQKLKKCGDEMKNPPDRGPVGRHAKLLHEAIDNLNAVYSSAKDDQRRLLYSEAIAMALRIRNLSAQRPSQPTARQRKTVKKRSVSPKH